jgi:hypothetical protein
MCYEQNKNMLRYIDIHVQWISNNYYDLQDINTIQHTEFDNVTSGLHEIHFFLLDV